MSGNRFSENGYFVILLNIHIVKYMVIRKVHQTLGRIRKMNVGGFCGFLKRLLFRGMF